ncbi:hypothetical protein GY45DRAFT_1374182 [Cubamyces sp. BRFM 1775]|nr:hypothetical protein GY45DRAFT_1374182 [Cubamyces sp. BRFM 1775]
MTAAILNTYPPDASGRNDGAHHTPGDTTADARYLTRTPSPTPSEAELLSPTKKKRPGILLNLLDPAKLKDPKELIRVLITFAIIGLVILFIVYQQKIVDWLKPFTDWMRRTPGGWLVPIAILIVLSFPPLFGHEIIAVLCGDAWGVGIGFAIVAAGTLLGELANYYVFRWFCMTRGRKIEAKSLQYALLAEVVRQGGFKIAVLVRLSAIPGHLTTAVFASCGMNVLAFLGAAILSLPKQLVTVYLGVSQNGESSRTKTVKTIVIVATVLLTSIAMHYIRAQQEKVKETVVYRRRKARQAKLQMAAGLNPDPELGPDAADHLRPAVIATKTIKLDGVALQVPNPQYPSASSSQPLVYDARPSPSYYYQQQPAAGGPWQPENYSLGLPELGYGARGRSPSRSPQPSSAPYGSAEGEAGDKHPFEQGRRMRG